MIFYVFRITFRASILHWFWNALWYHFWCFVDTFSVRARNLLNLQKNNVYLLTIGKNMIVDDVHDLFHYLCLHLFLMSVGIEFGTPLAYNSMFLGDRFGRWFSVWNLDRFRSITGPKSKRTWLPFSSLFRPCSAGSVFEGSLAHLLLRFWIHFGSVCCVRFLIHIES